MVTISYEKVNGQFCRVISIDGVKRAYESANENKVETIRIDSNNVQDVSYQFDWELGEYVETGRITRYLPDPTVKSPLELKLTELNAACNAAILAGFTSSALITQHTYDFDYDAQINLGGMLNAITAGIITGTITWKASGTPQSHSIEQFKTVFGDGLTHKNAQIGKYWTLKAQAIAAETPEQLDAIVW